MKWSFIFILTGLLLASLSAFTQTNVAFSTISVMTTKIIQSPFKMILLGMVLMGLGSLLRRKTIR